MKKGILFVVLAAIVGGGYYFLTKKEGGVEEEDPEAQMVPGLEEKTEVADPFEEELAAYYEIDFIKEWYPERIYPEPFDFDISLKGKTLDELRILRNELFARKGYLFEDAIARGHFMQYEWYQPIFDVPDFKVKLTSKEKRFITKVKEAEETLKKQPFVEKNGHTFIAFNQVLNTSQFKNLGGSIQRSLENTNACIIPGGHKQMFHLYDYNHYQYIPNFVTTDSYLQLLHKYFSGILKHVEEEQFIPMMRTMLNTLYTQSYTVYKESAHKQEREAAAYLTTYIAIGSTALTGEEKEVPEEMQSFYKEEVEKIQNHSGNRSDFLGISNGMTDYQQFTPRGNYTKSEALKKYFTGIKWLNYAPFFLDEKQRFDAVLLLADMIRSDRALMKDYTRFNSLISMMAGEEDNLSIGTVIEVLDTLYKGIERKEMYTRSVKKELIAALKKREVNKIQAQTADKNRMNVLFTAGRYSMDAAIFMKLVHVDGVESKRPYPRGLDVFSVLGNQKASHIIEGVYKDETTWEAYPEKVDSLQQVFAAYSDWDKNLYTKTMQLLLQMNKSDGNYPGFMQTDFWKTKNVSTSLAAWATLKHDLILYSEPAFAAQGGQGGGPPPPQHLSYVEPNIKFWEHALALLKLEKEILQEAAVYTDHLRFINEELEDLANLLLNVSKKQLKKEKVTEKEFIELSWIGARMERILFRIFKTDHLPKQEADMAVVADVYNYKQFLEAGTGHADEVYVVAEINGSYYITRGAVFSYYEFLSPSPMTDMDWQEKLKTNPKRPRWIRNTLITPAKPLETKPSYALMGDTYGEE